MPHRSCLPAGVRFLAPAAVLVLASTAAHAGSFAPDGTWQFDPLAAFTESFEEFTIDADAGTSSSMEIMADDGALDGSKVMHGVAQYESVDVRLSLPPTPGVWQATAWLRTDTVAGIVVENADGSPGDYSQLFPTGRMTSDGWIEMESAPFTSDGAPGTSVYAFFFGDEIVVDAIEVVRTPEADWAPARACTGVVDPSCSGDHLCLGGWCRNVAGWVPPAPEGQQRALFAQYLGHRLQYFFGPYFNRKHRLPAALAEIEGMKSGSSRWNFWRTFATAVHRLQDTHTSIFSLSDYIIENRRPLNACFIVGDADLSPQPTAADWPDILVSHAGDEANWGLHAGDRLVAIDGRHPIEWMKSLISHDFAASDANDPASISMIAERMRGAIPRYARAITVVHCSGATCQAPEDILVSSIPESPPDAQLQPVACDHRPGQLVPGQPENHSYGLDAIAGPVLSTEPSEKIYGLVWDYLIVQTSGATQIAKAVSTWRNDGKGVVLDHRTGNGGSGAPGTTASADPIVQFVRIPTFFGVELWRQSVDEEGPETLEQGLDLVAKYKNTSLAWKGGSNTAKTNVPVALLITRDVSFSDLFPYAVHGAPKVRIFGPHPTNGAFSTFLGLSYAAGINFQIAIGDTIGADGQALCGHGVEPDEVLIPKQSDLAIGKDTAIERALQWVRSEVTP